MPPEQPVHPPIDFQGVYDEFLPKIRRYLERLLRPGDAEDVAQEVFAKVSVALRDFRGESSLSTWIYRIATNTAYDRLRKPPFQRLNELSIEGDDESFADRSSGIDQTLVRQEMADCIDEFVGRLPPNYRTVLVLSEYEGLANQEIADALDLSLDTVKIRLHRARTRLRKELAGGCDFYRDDRNELACDPKKKGVSRGE